MISWLFSLVSLAFLVVAIAVGMFASWSARASKRRLDEAFGGFISCPTGRLTKAAEEADRITNERLPTMKHKRISFTDLSGVH